MSFDFDMNLYRVFYSVVKNNSFSKAADELFVTQPSISYSIKQLEEQLNIKLFKRNHNGIKITPEGKEVFEYVKKSYDYIRNGERVLMESRELKSGKLSIGVQSHIGRFFLFQYIEKFHKNYPNIEINISSRNTSELIKLLENNDIDFVIDTSPIETIYKNIVIEPLMKLEHCFAASNNYLTESKSIDIQKINKYNLILPVNNSTPRKQLDQLLKSYNIDLKPYMTIETTEMMIDAIKKNMGIGYILKKAIEKELNTKEIQEIKVNVQLPELLLNLVYIDNNLTYVPKAFMQEIKKVKNEIFESKIES